MNEKVKSLYDNLNLKTTPKIILDYFNSLGSSKDFFGSKPLNTQFTFNNQNINFFYNYGEKKHIMRLIDDEKILDEDYNLLTIDVFYNTYLLEYGKGFQKGFYEFKKSLKKENSLFTIKNDQIIHKVFSKVVPNSVFRKVVGGFPISFINYKEMIEVYKIHQTKDLSCLKKEAYFKNGFEGGEFYKAWSIILHNSTLFEDIFNKQFKDKEIDKPQLKNKENNAPKRFAYFEIGILIAQGKLSKVKEGVFMYNNKTFQKAELLKELDLDLKITSFRQYIEGTFKAYPHNTDRLNLKGYKSKMKKIIEYCKYHKIDVTKEYQTIFDSLE
ncbi:hypothetical protein [Polaribacter sp. IC073]|uniref:hypothetical protein n=1 Tax=Polaribacter sp. IC073 TaxID=2508540 RepID=UPI0011BDC5E8|nr:hypothetical protein [Polaribacter sp. IC073]TXD47730.1 hypothetical protein ES045_10605 [Polaribacter sp. IC073]